jgi:hypothetical protein
MCGEERARGQDLHEAADGTRVGSLIRSVAILASALIVLGFAFFAADEMDRGSKTQQNALDAELSATNKAPAPIAVAPTAAEEAQRERANSGFRELIDDSNDVLLAPFSDLADSSSNWVTRGVPTLLGLLLYGLGLGLLANMLPKQREHGADWRTA